MLLVNIHDAKTHLSKYVKMLDSEGEIILCNRNVPVAVIRPVPVPSRQRAIGLEKGRLDVPDGINEPLPEDVEALFNGESK